MHATVLLFGKQLFVFFSRAASLRMLTMMSYAPHQRRYVLCMCVLPPSWKLPLHLSTNRSDQIGDMLLVLAGGWFILCDNGLLAYWLEQLSSPIILAC